MTAKPNVSTVIPVHNRPSYVEEAIKSVLDQSVVPGEIIVVDDGSTDSTPDVIKALGDQVTYVRQENAGPGAARNRGISRATGDFLTFLDSDDLWPNYKIERQLSVLEETPTLGLVFGHVQQFICPSVPSPDRDTLECPPDPVPGFHVGTMMARRSVFDSVGMFETHWKVGEFVSWFARAREADVTLRMLPEVLLRRRIHGTNVAIEQRDNYEDFARILKQSIDRRRSKDGNRGRRL